MIKELKEESDIFLFTDLHNHSRSKNIFFYSCTGKDPLKREHILPLLMEKYCSVFNYANCSFAVQKEKESTARIALWKEFDISNCYTLEMSFCGPNKGKYDSHHMNIMVLKEIAFSIC